MTTRIGFPSQGELIQFVYEAAGILPRKKDALNEFDEKEKKRLQKSLERLAAEDGALNPRFSEMTATLSFMLCGSVPNERIVLALGDVLFDLFCVYQAVIRDDGSFFTKSESMRWFISNYAIQRLVTSVNKHLLRYNVAADALASPDAAFWFLPSIDGEDISWPLGKVMKWAYQICQWSQTQFHYPGKNDFSEDLELRQNLDSALKWSAGISLPSWPVLLQNFDTAFKKMNCTDNKKRESIVVALFIARVSTFVAQAIQKQFGIEYLNEIIEQYKRYTGWIDENVLENKKGVAEYLANKSSTQEEIDATWMVITDDYWRWFADISNDCSHRLTFFMSKSDDNTSVTEEQLNWMINKYGRYAICPGIEWVEREKKHTLPDDFNPLLTMGLTLRSRGGIAEIDAYCATLSKSNISSLMPWMEPWLRASLCYRNEDYESAFEYYKVAFEFSKYSAGKHQIDLVNQYIQVSAKTNHWKEFKKSIEWAIYLEIKISFLNTQKPTEADLKSLYKLMKSYHYSP